MAEQADSSIGLTTEQAAQTHRQVGWNEVIEKKPSQLIALLTRFWGPSAWMIEAIVILLSLVLLMGAIPVALPVMFSVSTAIAARELGKRGVLVTRLSAAEDAATMDTLCVDKTGTLTQNRMSVVALIPAPGVAESELLIAATLASDASDQDAIDGAIFKAAKRGKDLHANRVRRDGILVLMELNADVVAGHLRDNPQVKEIEIVTRNRSKPEQGELDFFGNLKSRLKGLGVNVRLTGYEQALQRRGPEVEIGSF